MIVKFTDDLGSFEDGIDTGGPKREFLCLLVRHLQKHHIFEGPEDQRFLKYDSRGYQNNEHFLAGRIIAVSLVHGGPAPTFLSTNFLKHILGMDSTFNVEIDDKEIKTVLCEIQSAGSTEELVNAMEKHSVILHLAACLRAVRNLRDKEHILQD